MSTIKVGATIMVLDECILQSRMARDCTAGKEYTVIPYSEDSKYQLADTEDDGYVSFIDDVGGQVTLCNYRVKVIK